MSYPAVHNLPPIHPGELLADDLEALGMSARKFAAHIGVPPNAISAILNGKRSVSAQMAHRLGRAFGTSARYWMALQADYDEKVAMQELGDSLNAIQPLAPLPPEDQ